MLEAGFAEYLKGFTDAPAPAELLDREGVPRRQPFLKRSLPAEVRPLTASPFALTPMPARVLSQWHDATRHSTVVCQVKHRGKEALIVSIGEDPV